MPYEWTSPDSGTETLTLWPYQSLRPRGYAGFIGATGVLVLVPLLAVLGSVLLWGLLPFVVLAVGGVWYALDRNRRERHIVEVLTLSGDTAHLIRHAPKSDPQEWDCNRYWTRVALHQNAGPVPNYVTLSGKGREVEIGAFLSEEERVALYDDLTRALKR